MGRTDVDAVELASFARLVCKADAEEDPAAYKAGLDGMKNILMRDGWNQIPAAAVPAAPAEKAPAEEEGKDENQ